MNPDRAAMISSRPGARDEDGDRDDRGSNRRPNRITNYSSRDARRENRPNDRQDRHGRDRRDRDCDFTAPRHDRNNRVSKPSSSTSSRNPTPQHTRYLTQDEQSQQYVADEDKFVLQQAKKKADIRVRENRATPIDNLAFPLRYIEPARDDFDFDEGDVDIDVPEAHAVLARASPAQLRELKEEISSYRTLETNAVSREYWVALYGLCVDRLASTGSDSRVVESVKADIDKILSPKTFDQLEALEKQIRAKLDSDDDIDVDYWEQLLKSLLVWKSRAKLSKITTAIREARAEALKERDPEKAKALEAGLDLSAVPAPLPSNKPAERTSAPLSAPKPSSSTDAPPPGTARFAQTGPEDFSSATKALYDREVARGIRDDEEIFSTEEAVPDSAGGAMPPIWANKYRPRKPRYFNRVQMGYEWNKYNQTHYDHDNPPPKVVQGYKFNIFYPDLIDKTKAPTFKIIRENGRRRGESSTSTMPGENDTCLIRFIAGPPYEDIAFRIVDREWDYSSKRERGFKSSFDNGILQLHFQFKRIFYRK
ncbi:Uncharacterized protein C2F12.12c [Ceratocystis fimbriata CBS 114723]|uniref:Splicing factor Cactin n=1 Tax=Ceratocystis fimbriata CBS 114723 TaxID=1035309 RepID=A0A2C5XJU7_9PEZI|nr:Uncharacterized protein C2F12.12c [Ceratocystis fimbriata CBS 114723]